MSNSVYRKICRLAEEHPQLPYSFQEEQAGSSAIKYYLNGERLPHLYQEKLANVLVDLLVACLEGSKTLANLQRRAEALPIFGYLGCLSKRIRLYLDEGLLPRDKLYHLALELTTESPSDELVKLGMIILGSYENDLVRKILRTIGLHSSYTLYALESAQHFQNSNRFTYDLARHTANYGKLAALFWFQPITSPQREWFFNQGVASVMPSFSALLCLEKTDMHPFFLGETWDRASFTKLSALLAYALKITGIIDLTLGRYLVRQYLQAAPAMARDFIDLAALVYIKQGLQEQGQRPEDHELLLQVDALLDQPRWQYAIAQELSTPRHHGLVITVLRETKTVPAFWDLVPLIAETDFCLEVMKFLFEHPDEYLVKTHDFLSKILPDEVRGGPQASVDVEQDQDEYRPDIWLLYLLKTMRNQAWFQEDFVLSCLQARFPDVRIEALRLLRSHRRDWSEQVPDTLADARKSEPVPEIASRIQRLLGSKDLSTEYWRKQEVVDPDKHRVRPSMLDIPLLNTYIAGTNYRDLASVKDIVQGGDFLWLLREKNNEHDNLAIKVMADDGLVLGYIPRMDNSIPSALLDAGEKLYAVFLSEDLSARNPRIQLKLCRSKKQEKSP